MKQLLPYIILLVLLCLIGGAIFYFIRRRGKVKLTRDEHDLFAGKRFGQFELRSFLWRDEFGPTFEAFDPETNRPVSLRILSRKYMHVDDFVTQFLLKGETLKFLSETFPGNHFVQDVRFGHVMVNEEQRPYIVSAYVPGATLAEVLQRHRRLSPMDTYTIIKQVAEGVALGHKERIWFRELSPENILLTLDSARRLVARIANVGVQFRSLPSKSFAEAKRPYYSPEDCTGEEVDERSDVYALASLMFRMRKGVEMLLSASGRLPSSALAEEPAKRPGSVEKFLASIQGMSSSQSSVAYLSWEDELKHIVIERTKLKVVRSDRDEIEPSWKTGKLRRVILQPPPQVKQSIMTAAFTALLLWLGKKVEWLLEKPVRLFLAGLVALGGIVFAVFKFSGGESGELMVTVFERGKGLSNPVAGASVIVEAKDLKTGALVPVKLKDRRTDKQEEGMISLKTSRNGIVRVEYRGDIDRKHVGLHVTAKSDSGFVESSKVVSLDTKEDLILEDFLLKPVRKGTITMTIDDPTREIRRPGAVPPQFIEHKLYATDAQGAPLGTARFWVADQQFLMGLPGVGQSTKIPFALGKLPSDIRFEVEDGATITVETTPSEAQLPLAFTLVPSKFKVTEKVKALAIAATIVRRQGSDNATFLFKVIAEDNSPAQGITIVLNDLNLGATDENGMLEYPVPDLKLFWDSRPVIRLDLRSYNIGWGVSRPYALTQSMGRNISINIADVRPQ